MFTQLMQQYQPLVYTVCVRFVHNPDTAQDLTQDTFLSAFTGIDRCEPEYYKQWLIRVAANKCKDHLRSGWVRKVSASTDGTAETLPEPLPTQAVPPGPEQALDEKAGAGDLFEQVRGLREPYGSVAVLYLLENKSVAQIARALNRPEATVQNQLFRAKVLLRKQIAERRQTEWTAN